MFGEVYVTPSTSTVDLNLSAFDGPSLIVWYIDCGMVLVHRRGGLDGQNKFKLNIAYIIDDHEDIYILKWQTNGLNMSQQWKNTLQPIYLCSKDLK